MYVGYFYAVRGAIKQLQRMDTVANNLANAATPGFKKDRQQFEDFLINQVQTDFSQGALRETEREFDVALQGDGFFKVMTPNGPAYTRDGTFHRRGDGTLVNSDGYPVMGDGGPISLGTETGQIGIDITGNITRGSEVLGSLTVVDVKDKTHLRPGGGSTLIWTGQGQPQEVPAVDYGVYQGHLEQANVSPVSEMVHMIDSNRSFEAFTKAIKSFQDIDTKATQQVGRLK